jgi:hypothetical protein
MRVTLVCGMAQQGKTTRALALVERESERCIVLDIVRSKALAGVPLTWHNRVELAKFLANEAESSGRWVGCLRSSDFQDYVWVLRAAPYLRHCTLLIDEALTFATAQDSIDPLIHLARMNAHFGGGLGVPIIMTAQRPGDLPPDVRSQATRIISFRQREPRDLQWLAAFCSPDYSAQVAELDEGSHASLTFPPSIAPSVTAEPEVDHEGRNPGRCRRGPAGTGGVPAVPEAERHRQNQAADEVGAAHVQDQHQ